MRTHNCGRSLLRWLTPALLLTGGTLAGCPATTADEDGTMSAQNQKTEAPASSRRGAPEDGGESGERRTVVDREVSPPETLDDGPAAETQQVETQDVQAGDDASPPSSLQECLCFPDGSTCSPMYTDKVFEADATKACPEGEVCTGSYATLSGLCVRHCYLSDVDIPGNGVCHADEVCRKFAVVSFEAELVKTVSVCTSPGQRTDPSKADNTPKD